MRHVDPASSTGQVEPWAVHQFIRVYGRRPTPEELTGLRNLAVSAPYATRGDSDGAPLVVAGNLTRAVRREAAKLIHRL